MRSVGATIDRRLAGVIVTRLHRTWPMLKLLPAAWLVLVVTPAARRLRRSLYRDAAAVVLIACAVVVAAGLLI